MVSILCGYWFIINCIFAKIVKNAAVFLALDLDLRGSWNASRICLQISQQMLFLRDDQNKELQP